MKHRRIDEGPPRAGRRPDAHLNFPILIHVADSPSSTVLEVDGQVIGLVKSFSFAAELDENTGHAKQKLTLRLFDKDNQNVRVGLVDRLHEMTERNPYFELDFDIVPWGGNEE